MSTQPQILIDPNTNQPGYVSADKLQDAINAGYEPAVKMISKDGVPGYVAQSKVDAAKSAGFVLHPDSFLKPTIDPRRDDPMARGGLADDYEVNQAAARNMANLTPQQKQALAFSDRAQTAMGTGMAYGAAAGTAAVAAPVVAPVVNPLLKSPLFRVAGGVTGGEMLAEYLKRKLMGGK